MAKAADVDATVAAAVTPPTDKDSSSNMIADGQMIQEEDGESEWRTRLQQQQQQQQKMKML